MSLPARLIAAGATLICLAPAQAAVTFYTDETSFLSAVGSQQATMGYEGIAPAGGTTSIFGTHSEDGLNISNIAIIIDDGLAGGVYNVGSGDNAQTNPNVVSTVTWDSGPMFAASLEYFTVQPSGAHAIGNVRLTLASGEFIDLLGPASGDNFIGFITDAAVTSFSLRTISPSSGDGRRWLETDNISVYDRLDTASVPVPAPLALVGLGLLGMTCRRHRARA